MHEVEEYYRKNYKKLCKMAHGRVKSVEGAEDIVQNSFLNSIQYYKSFNPEIAKFEQWFMGIFSRCIKQYQREERLGGMSVELKEDQLFTSGEALEDCKTLTEIKELIGKKKNLEVRQALHLHFIEQYTPREILQVIDIKRTSLVSHLKRFRKVIKGIYVEEV